MKIIKSQQIPSRPYSDDSWDYKGYKCKISYEVESDNAKAYHDVITPQGQSISADINPYDGSRKTFEMWIDAGMPQREGGMPWDQARLSQKLQGGTALSFVNYFNLKKEAQVEPPHRGILPPKSNDTEWLTNQEPTQSKDQSHKEKEGDQISGSQMFRAFCDICGQPIRVSQSTLKDKEELANRGIRMKLECLRCDRGIPGGVGNPFSKLNSLENDTDQNRPASYEQDDRLAQSYFNLKKES